MLQSYVRLREGTILCPQELLLILLCYRSGLVVALASRDTCECQAVAPDPMHEQAAAGQCESGRHGTAASQLHANMT